MPTKIEWAEETWNPVTGCSPISEGCRNCYAERMSKRLAGRCGYPEYFPFWVTLHPDKLEQPLRWKKPRMIFVCSMGDLFHEDVPEIEIMRVFAVMADAQQHTYLVLTKRPERMKEVLTSPSIANDVWLMTNTGISEDKPIWPLPNVWLGVTAENQARADERIPVLLQIPAAVRFVSIEPMLGTVNLTLIGGDRFGWGRTDAVNGLYYVRANPTECGCEWETQHINKLDWVICGGETGPGARPMHPDWVRSLRDQCKEAGVPFFFKSWGEWMPSYQTGATFELSRLKTDEVVMSGPGHGVVMKKVGKKAAGRLLDGQEWNQYPEVRA